MRIIVNVFLRSESFSRLLHLHAETHIEILFLGSGGLVIFSILRETRIIGILHILSGMTSIFTRIYTFLNEFRREILYKIEFTLKIYHGTRLAASVYHEQRGDIRSFCHFGVISTECRSYMNDTGTIVCGDIISTNDTERTFCHLHKAVVADCENVTGISLGKFRYVCRAIFIEFLDRLDPWHKLLIMHAYEIFTGESAYNTVWQNLVTLFIFLK